MLPGAPILEIPELIERSELVILAVPESELARLVSGLAVAGVWQAGQLILHTAPSFGTDVLAPATELGAIPLAVHPAMSFTGTSIDLSRLRESYCAVTCPVVVQPIGQALVVEMGAEPVIVDEAHRAAYAEAITIATSFSTAIVAQATGLLDEIGISSPGQVLAPLVRSTVENALGSCRARYDRCRLTRPGSLRRPGGSTVKETMTGSPTVLPTIASVRAALAGRDGVVLVPTMGALHDGHLALVQRAQELGSTVVVSIFVNPLQFGAGEDLERYPRTLDDDLARLGAAGVPLVFAPAALEVYPHGALETRVSAGAIGNLYEGASRPGHFDGVLTVVAKLLNIVQPEFVVFGRKDAQQVYLVQRMIEDLNIPVTVDVVDTVREDSGLALSSRNQFLDARQKRAARALSLSLEAAASSADRGIDAILAAAQGTLMGEPLVQLDYLKVVHPNTFLPVDDDHRGAAIVLVAATVGGTRLIDNEVIVIGG